MWIVSSFGAVLVYGEAKFIRTHTLKQQLLIVTSERKLGYAYKFMRSKENQYICVGCKKLKKYWNVTVMDGRVIGSKHPEDDHHANCEPFAQNVIDALDADREMRNSVSSTGKRPRDAYAEAVGSIPTKFKSSAVQEAVIVNFPVYHEFGASHPSPRTSLIWLQQFQFEVQCRWLQLLARRSAKPRSAVYMNLTADIIRAKVDLSLKLGNIFVNIFPDTSAWQVLNVELSTYLHRDVYLCSLTCICRLQLV